MMNRPPNMDPALWLAMQTPRERRTASQRALVAEHDAGLRAGRFADLVDAVTEARRRRLEALAPPLDRDGWRRLLAGDIEPSASLRRIGAWDAEPHPAGFLGLLGATGVGKTFGAVWWLVGHRLPDPASVDPDDERAVEDLTYQAQWAGGYVPGAYVHAAELTRLSRHRFGEEAARFLAILDAERLIVDELGSGAPGPEDREMFFRLVDARLRPGRRTVLIGNLSAERLLTVYAGRGSAHEDARLLDRLRGGAAWTSVGGRSRRSGSLP